MQKYPVEHADAVALGATRSIIRSMKLIIYSPFQASLISGSDAGPL